MQPPGRLLVKVVDRNDLVVQHAVVGSGEGRAPITGEVGKDGVASLVLSPGFHWVSVDPPSTPPPPGSAWLSPKPAYVLIRGGRDTLTEMRLLAAPLIANHVRGRVIDEAGDPAQGATVSMFRTPEQQPGIVVQDCGPSGWCGASGGGAGGGKLSTPRAEFTGKTDHSGAFEFASVPSGSWTLHADHDAPGGGALRGGAAATISEDRNDLNIRLNRPFKLKILVQWKDRPGPHDVFWSPEFCWRRPSQPSHLEAPFLGANSPASLLLQDPEAVADGVFPGPYIVRAVGDPAPNPVSIFLGSQDVTGTEFILNAESPSLRVL